MASDTVSVFVCLTQASAHAQFCHFYYHGHHGPAPCDLVPEKDSYILQVKERTMPVRFQWADTEVLYRCRTPDLWADTEVLHRCRTPDLKCCTDVRTLAEPWPAWPAGTMSVWKTRWLASVWPVFRHLGSNLLIEYPKTVCPLSIMLC